MTHGHTATESRRRITFNSHCSYFRASINSRRRSQDTCHLGDLVFYFKDLSTDFEEQTARISINRKLREKRCLGSALLHSAESRTVPGALAVSASFILKGVVRGFKPRKVTESEIKFERMVKPRPLASALLKTPE